MLDLRRLAIFKTVADEGSFSAAALSLDYTQSVVSHHIARLEDELGVSLLDRERRPVTLTPAGERLRAHADNVLGAAATAEADMRAVAGLETGILRVGAFLTACSSFVPSAVGAFEAEHPGVDVRIDQQEPPVALPRLIAGELDVAVVYTERGNPSGPDPRLERIKLGDDPYRVVLPPGHRLARRRELGIADLEGEKFSAPVAAGGGLEYRMMLERLCAAAGFSPNIVHDVDTVIVARAYVAAGLCIGLMPEMTVPPPHPDVVVKPVRGVEPFRTVEVMWVRGRRVPGVAPMVAALRAARA